MHPAEAPCGQVGPRESHFPTTTDNQPTHAFQQNRCGQRATIRDEKIIHSPVIINDWNIPLRLVRPIHMEHITFDPDAALPSRSQTTPLLDDDGSNIIYSWHFAFFSLGRRCDFGTKLETSFDDRLGGFSSRSRMPVIPEHRPS